MFGIRSIRSIQKSASPTRAKVKAAPHSSFCSWRRHLCDEPIEIILVLMYSHYTSHLLSGSMSFSQLWVPRHLVMMITSPGAMLFLVLWQFWLSWSWGRYFWNQCFQNRSDMYCSCSHQHWPPSFWNTLVLQRFRRGVSNSFYTTWHIQPTLMLSRQDWWIFLSV